MVWVVVLCWAGFMSFCCVVVYAVTGTWLIVLVCRFWDVRLWVVYLFIPCGVLIVRLVGLFVGWFMFGLVCCLLGLVFVLLFVVLVWVCGG